MRNKIETNFDEKLRYLMKNRIDKLKDLGEVK